MLDEDLRPEHFGHRPRLGDAPARRVGLVAVEYLADKAHARPVEMGIEAAQPVAGLFEGEGGEAFGRILLRTHATLM